MRITYWTHAAGGVPPPPIVSSMLQMVSVSIPGDWIADRWTRLELLQAYDWAAREYLHASDNPVQRRTKPWFIIAAEDIVTAIESVREGS